jgi:hypothetical protein
VNGKNGGAQPLYLHASFNGKKENLEKNCTKNRFNVSFSEEKRRFCTHMVEEKELFGMETEECDYHL